MVGDFFIVCMGVVCFFIGWGFCKLFNHKIEFFARWHNRWLEIAKQFKESK